MASDAAERMAQKVYGKKIADAQANLSELLEKLVKEYVPSPVLACVKEYSDYIEGTNSVYINTSNKSGYVQGTISFPIPWRARNISVSAQDFGKANDVYEKYLSVKDERGEFRDKVEGTLLSLCTAKRVAESFPEAMDYLDFPQEKQLPSPALSELRQMIASVK